MLKTIRYILLLGIIALAGIGIMTVNLAYQPFIYLLASLYVGTLIAQAKQEQKKSLVIFYSAIAVAAVILFVVAIGK